MIDMKVLLSKTFKLKFKIFVTTQIHRVKSIRAT